MTNPRKLTNLHIVSHFPKEPSHFKKELSHFTKFIPQVSQTEELPAGHSMTNPSEID